MLRISHEEPWHGKVLFQFEDDQDGSQSYLAVPVSTALDFERLFEAVRSFVSVMNIAPRKTELDFQALQDDWQARLGLIQTVVRRTEARA